MIRLLIWTAAALALGVFFYMSLDGGGAPRSESNESAGHAIERATSPLVEALTGAPAASAAARREAALAAQAESAPAAALPARPAAEALVIAPGTRAGGRDGDIRREGGRGLSFALAPAATVPARVAHLACHGDPVPIDRPHRGSCNPYEGDTSCRAALPVACILRSDAAAPAGLAQDFYKGWTSGRLAATAPVAGVTLSSESAASARCEAELGAGWRMAEFHDGGGGWGLQGERGAGLRAGTRYWVHINDQPGNCWNSAP